MINLNGGAFLKLAIAAMAGAALAACATSTPYQPADSYGRGFSDQRIESDRYRVTFSGNTLTPRETVENYLLYRAAELTVQNGYDYFIVTEGDVDSRTSFRTYSQGYAGFYGFPYTVYGLHARRHFGLYGAYGAYPAYDTVTRERQEFTATAEIIMGRGEKPADETRAYDAREVLRNLAPTITRAPR
ncbi:MAG: hypothetical protein Tsb0010_12740 [Parvularculaceae bacterium]